MNHLSLFSGIGGIDLAASWAGFETVAFCEQNKFCQKVLSKHWPEVPIFDDIFTLTAESLERRGIRTDSVKLISGGFPCQPYSHAGKRMGNEDVRALWPEMFRVIKEVRPDWVCGENVTGIISMALDGVLSDLESAGYTCQPVVLPACAVNAPHRRERVFIIAHSKHNGHPTGQRAGSVCGSQQNQGRQEEPGSIIQSERGGNQSRLSKAMAYTEREGLLPGPLTGVRSGEESTGSRNVHAERCGETVAYTKVRSVGNDSQDERQTCGEKYPPCHTSCACRGHDRPRNGEAVADTAINGRQQSPEVSQRREPVPTLRGEAFRATGQWSVEPGVGRVANGVSGRVDRLRALGNAVVPQQIYPILKAIADYEMADS
jgi:DNA (cytosine-5)-methyltransferase 1